MTTKTYNPYKDTTLQNMQRIFEFVGAYYAEHKIPPTQPEIAEHVTGSKANVGNMHPLISKLIEEGFLYRASDARNAPRTLMVADPPPRPFYYRRDQ